MRDLIPQLVAAALCVHLAAVVHFSKSTTSSSFRAEPAWDPYLARMYLFSLATVFGMMVWVTFVAGIVSQFIYEYTIVCLGVLRTLC